MDLAVKLLTSRLRGDRYPPDGVEDTAEARDLWNQIGSDLVDMKKAGVTPEIPYEYADDPEDD